jgi:hypothetical protein
VLADGDRRGGLLVMLTEHAHPRSPATGAGLFLAGGDDEPGGDVAQAQLLAPEVERGGSAA